MQTAVLIQLKQERVVTVKNTPSKIAARLVPLFLTVLFLLGTLTDLRAEMFSVGDAGGLNREETREANTNVTHSSGTNTGINTGTLNPAPGSFINPLTGQYTVNDFSMLRPVAISISNQRGALPTNAINGISQADIVYEVLVEAGITRFVGIYQDFTSIDVVGSIRSARHYTVQLAEAYDAIFVHAGGSPLGYEEIENRGITNFDEVSGKGAPVFLRNQQRIPGHTVENYHSVTTSGARLTQWLPISGERLVRGHNRQPLAFTDNPIPTGVRAYEVGIRFSDAKDSAFIYNESQNVYFMAQFGSYLTDANNGSSVTFTNLLILETPVTDLVGHGSGAGRQDMSTVGSGNGLFISGGKCITINWFRADKASQFVYTCENGNVIELGRGKTYIGIIPTDTGSLSIN